MQWLLKTFFFKSTYIQTISHASWKLIFYVVFHYIWDLFCFRVNKIYGDNSSTLTAPCCTIKPRNDCSVARARNTRHISSRLLHDSVPDRHTKALVTPAWASLCIRCTTNSCLSWTEQIMQVNNLAGKKVPKNTRKL